MSATKRTPARSQSATTTKKQQPELTDLLAAAVAALVGISERLASLEETIVEQQCRVELIARVAAEATIRKLDQIDEADEQACAGALAGVASLTKRRAERLTGR